MESFEDVYIRAEGACEMFRKQMDEKRKKEAEAVEVAYA